MKAVEFFSSIRPDGTLELPPAVAELLREHEDPLRVLVLVPEDEDDAQWRRMTAEEFMAGYADSDAIYDKLQSG
jgi:hypothetical protein